MLRTPLEELCLEVRLGLGLGVGVANPNPNPNPNPHPNPNPNEVGSLRLGPAQEVLAKALSPPPPETVARALASLRMLGALADEEGARLSPLGAALAQLAVHPRLGKLLLLSGLRRSF